MERPAAPEDDRRRELEREPLPAVELERRDHREREHRQRQRSGDEQSEAERRGRILLLRDGLVARERGLVAGRLDRRDQLLRRDRVRVELDRGTLGRVVDRRGDAVELVQLLLDADGARRARHPFDRQLEPLRAHLTLSDACSPDPTPRLSRSSARPTTNAARKTTVRETRKSATRVTPPPSPAARSRGGNPVSPASPLRVDAAAAHRRRVPSGEPSGSPAPPPGGVTSSCRLVAGLVDRRAQGRVLETVSPRTTTSLLSRSASTDSTPGTRPTSSSTAALQWPQLMPLTV